MAVLERKSSTSKTLTLSATPTAGQFVVVTVGLRFPTSNTATAMSGGGATWNRIYQHGIGPSTYDQMVEVWVGTGFTSAGPITYTQQTGGSYMTAFHLSSGNVAGITVNRARAWVTGDPTDGSFWTTDGALKGPDTSAGSGDVVIGHIGSRWQYPATVPNVVQPASGWSSVAVSPEIDGWQQFWTLYREPTATETHHLETSNANLPGSVLQIVVPAPAPPWTPNTKGSRLYFPDSTVSAVSPGFDSSWQVTTGAIRRKLQHKPTNDGGQYNTHSTSETSATPVYGLHDQYVSDPLPANKTISGSFMVTAQGRSGLFWRTVVRVVSNDGATVRGTLFSGLAATAFGSAAPFHNRVISGTLTSVNALAGDRIVVERGSYFNNTSTTSQSSGLGAHDGFGYPDAPASDASGDITINYRAWIEFSQPDIWGPPKPTLAGESTLVAEKPARTPTRLGGMNSIVAEKPARTPLRLGGISYNVGEKPAQTPLRLAAMSIQVLVPRAGQRVPGLYAAGFPETEPRILLPDGRWVPFRPIAFRPELSAKAKTPIVLYQSASYSGQTGTLSTTPLPTDLLVFMTSTGRNPPRPVIDPTTTIPDCVWTRVYASSDERHVAWFGTGATGPGTVTHSLSGGADANRACTLFLIRDAKPVLAQASESSANPSTHSFKAKRTQAIVVGGLGSNGNANSYSDAMWVNFASGLSNAGARVTPLVDDASPTTATISVGAAANTLALLIGE